MKRMLIGGIAVLGLFMTGCRKDPVENLTEEEGRIYITNYDTSAQFSGFRTFSIADSVAIVSNNQFIRRERTAFDAAFVSAIANELTARGYVRVNRNQDPDLGVAVSRVTNAVSNLVSYNDYGGYYGGYWDPYYWDYPGYGYGFPTYYGVYETRETALMVDAFDLKNAGQNNQIRSVWSGMIRGSGIFREANVQSQVSALLGQSPYLRYQ